MAETRVVKFLMVEFPALVPDPFDPHNNEVPAMRIARHGQTVSSDRTPDAPEDRDANTVYGIQDYDLNRLEEMGAFFTDLELQLFEAGASNDDSPEGVANIEGDHTASPLINPDLSTHAHPIAFGEYTVEQLAQLIKDGDIEAGELIEQAYADPSTADLILGAEALANDGDPREEVVLGVAEAVGRVDSGAVTDDDGASASDAPAKSASRGEWDAYAISVGVTDAADLGSKEAVQEAVAALEQ